MITKELINRFFGYVQFTAENGFPERFINTCTADNIPLWDISKHKETLTAKTTINGYRKIRHPARQSSMKIRIGKKVGLPFFIARHIKKTGLIVGFAVMIAMLIFLSDYVWIIEVTGNETVSDEKIIEAFDEAGLEIGSRIKTLKRPEIESKAMLNLTELSWASYNISGCIAEIKVREREPIPDIEKHSGTANIVASKDGQIVILEAYRGTASVRVGEAVTKGDLLVSGITESRLQTNLYTDADAYVVAKTEIKVETNVPLKTVEYIPKSRKVWSIYFLGKEIFPPRDREGVCYTNRSRLEINGRVLPFGINYRIYTVYEKKEKTISKAEAELMAMNKYAVECYNKTKHARILESDVKLEHCEDSVTVKGKYICYENIGEISTFEIEELPDSYQSDLSE